MPRSEIQNNEIIEQRKECILNASLYLFAIHGYQAITIDTIAKVCNCSRPLIYHYFGDKESLWRYVIRTNAEKIIKITKSINFNQLAHLALTEFVSKLLDTIKTSSLENPMSCVIYLLLNLYLEKDVIPPPITKAEERPLEERPLFLIAYHLIEQGQKEGTIKDNCPHELTVALMALIKALAYNKIYLKENATIPSTSILMDLILKKEVKQ